MPYEYDYPRPAVTVDCIIFQKLYKTEVLLIKRANPPFKTMWALPGGFVDENEALQTAAKRELLEETGLSGIALKQLQTFGNPGRDPRGHTVSVVFWGILKEEAKIKGGDDAAEAKWYPLNNLPKLAFDHKEILEFTIKTIKDIHL